MADTVARLVAVVAARDMKVFADIDHADEARTIGLALRDTRILILGSPTVSRRLSHLAVIAPARPTTGELRSVA